MHKAVTIFTSGEKRIVEFDDESCYTKLSDAVGGYIECVHLPSQNIDMWVNEEGKLGGHVENPLATALWNDEYGQTDFIMGNAIFTSGTDEEGNTLGLNDAQVEYLMAYDRKIWTLKGLIADIYG